MRQVKETETFLALVKAGLWEQDVELRKYGNVDFSEVLRSATEQAVVGLVAAGLEHVKDVKVPQEWVLQFIGQTLQIEQKNKLMNLFIAQQVEQMRTKGIYAVLVKGQGIAQCYERPLWRASGDVDYLLSFENYRKAKEYMEPLASNEKPERLYSKEKGYYIGQWLVELHGSLHTGLSSRVDKEVDGAQGDVFFGGSVRSWQNGRTQVFLPGADVDVFLVFSHFIKHFYKEGGVTLRQVCDWCRLMWTYRDSLNHGYLESRVQSAGLMDEWKSFAALAVDYLGMPLEAMPLYSADKKWSRKASQILAFILKGGEWHKWRDTMRVARIFPWSTIKFAPGILANVNTLKIKERINYINSK